MVHTHALGNLGVTVHELQPAGIVGADQFDHIVYLGRVPELSPGCVAPCPERHLAVLQHESGGGERRHVTDVVVVEMAHDHERNGRAVHAEHCESIRRTS